MQYVDALEGCVADDRAVFEDMNVDEWDVCRIISRIREVDLCLEIDGSLASAQDFHLANPRLQIAKATVGRDRCNLVSFGAVDLNK